MSYEKSRLLAEKLNVDRAPVGELHVNPDDYTRGFGDFESFTFSQVLPSVDKQA